MGEEKNGKEKIAEGRREHVVVEISEEDRLAEEERAETRKLY